jgi:hypothetical protein
VGYRTYAGRRDRGGRHDPGNHHDHSETTLSAATVVRAVSVVRARLMFRNFQDRWQATLANMDQGLIDGQSGLEPAPIAIFR